MAALQQANGVEFAQIYLTGAELNVGFAHHPNDENRHPTFQDDCMQQSFRKRMP
jgi:hypothetical protein